MGKSEAIKAQLFERIFKTDFFVAHDYNSNVNEPVLC